MEFGAVHQTGKILTIYSMSKKIFAHNYGHLKNALHYFVFARNSLHVVNQSLILQKTIFLYRNNESNFTNDDTLVKKKIRIVEKILFFILINACK